MNEPKNSPVLLRELCDRLRALADQPETEAARAEVEAALASKWWSLRVLAIRAIGAWGTTADKAWLIERALGAENGWTGGKRQVGVRQSWNDLRAQTAAEALKPLMRPDDAEWVLDRWFSDLPVAPGLHDYLMMHAPSGPIEARVEQELALRSSRQKPFALLWIAYLRRNLPGRDEVMQRIARRPDEAGELARIMLGWDTRRAEAKAAAAAPPKKGAARAARQAAEAEADAAARRRAGRRGRR